jgi:hypothetical protein
MKLSDGMGGNPHGLYQGAREPLGLSEAGRSVLVRSMPLKGTGEARGKPPRRRAWLRNRMVSSNEVGFNCLKTLPEGTVNVWLGYGPLPSHPDLIEGKLMGEGSCGQT